MNEIDIKTIALNAAVAGAARDGNIMEAAQRYYEWLKEVPVPLEIFAGDVKAKGSKK